MDSKIHSAEALHKIILLSLTCGIISVVLACLLGLWLLGMEQSEHTKGVGKGFCLFHVKGILQPLVWVKNVNAMI